MKKYVKADTDYAFTDDEMEISDYVSLIDSLCKTSYNTDSLYDMCYYFAGNYYEELYADWDGMYPEDEMYGKVEDGHWIIAFPQTLTDDSQFVEICFGKSNDVAMPVDYWDFDDKSYVISNFEYIEDLEPNYSRYEDTIYMFDKNGFDIDETEVEPVEFINKETDEILTFDTWDDAEDYAYKNF